MSSAASLIPVCFPSRSNVSGHTSWTQKQTRRLDQRCSTLLHPGIFRISLTRALGPLRRGERKREGDRDIKTETETEAARPGRKRQGEIKALRPGRQTDQAREQAGIDATDWDRSNRQPAFHIQVPKALRWHCST